MKHLQTVRINHTMRVYNDMGIIRVKLIDDSGDGDWLDRTRMIRQNWVGDWDVPVGKKDYTPASTNQILFLVDLLNLPVILAAPNEDGKPFVVPYKKMPQERGEREYMFSLSYQDIRHLEHQAHCEYRAVGGVAATLIELRRKRNGK